MVVQEDQYYKSNLIKEFRYFFIILAAVAVIFFGIFYYVRFYEKSNDPKDQVVIRIFPQSESQVKKLRELKFVKSSQTIEDFIEVKGRFRDVLELNYLGIPSVIVIESDQHATIDSVYPNYQEISDEINSLARSNSNIIKIEEIGKSQFNNLPLFAIKISENPQGKEDEPSVLFMAGHHAREPVGVQVCLSILKYLIKNKNKEETQKWLKNMAVWIVPCINPDGYDYVISNQLEYPWWRKNLHDNNNNGVFEPEFDGVDLNRNYDFNWEFGGSAKPETWYFKGDVPASESEISAVVKLAERERFIAAIDFHSFGEAVLYPWGMEMTPPDVELLKSLAQDLANNLKKGKKNKPYRIIPLNGKSGQSANWLYSKFRTLAFIVEVGPEYFPNEEMLNELVEKQLDVMPFFLNRILISGISGHISDSATKEPVQAMIQFENDFSPVVEPVRTDPAFGSFWRLVLPGRYTITAMADGYKTKELIPLKVNADRIQKVEIELEKLANEN